MSSTAVADGTEALDDCRTLEELLDSARWYLAATLTERRAARRRHGSPRHPFDGARAAARLERWKTQSAFVKHPELWDARLASAGATEDELLDLLGESAEDVRAYSERPAWLDVIAEAYGDGGRSAEFEWPPIIDPERCRVPPLIEPPVPRVARSEEQTS